MQSLAGQGQLSAPSGNGRGWGKTVHRYNVGLKRELNSVVNPLCYNNASKCHHLTQFAKLYLYNRGKDSVALVFRLFQGGQNSELALVSDSVV